MAKLRKRLRKAVKKVGRIHAKVASKAVKVVTPVLAGAATVFAGPAAGAAITAAGGGIARWSGATAARAKGIHGRHARKEGRKLAARTMKYGAIATGLGVGAAAVAGGSVFTGLLGAGKLAASTGGKIMPGTETKGLESDWSSLAAPTPGGSSGNDLSGVQTDWSSLYTPTGGASAPSSPQAAGESWSTAALGALGTIAGGLNVDPGEEGSGKPGDAPSDDKTYSGVGTGFGGFGGEGGDLLSNPLVLGAIAVGAVLLLRK